MLGTTGSSTETPSTETPSTEAAPTTTSSATVPDVTAAALLESSAIELTPAAAADLQRGIVDSRLVDLLAWITTSHSIAISEFKTGHGKYVTGTTRVSNNWYGRAVTITAVDGQPVSPDLHGRTRRLAAPAQRACRRSARARSAHPGPIRRTRATTRAPTR